MSQNDLWYYPYTLTNHHNINSSGALLRINEGFGAIHPWVQFKDLPLEAQLASIKNNTPTSLAKRSLHYIDIDRDAREKNICLFDKLQKIKSHRLFTSTNDLNINDLSNYDLIKIKISNTKEYILNLNKLSNLDNLTIRLDANANFSFSDFCNFWDSIDKSVKNKIQYVEDPCPYDQKNWQILAEDFNVPIAYDFYGNTNVEKSYKYRILKPMVQAVDIIIPDELQKDVKLCITSSLDHPFGISIAAWEYNNLYKEYPGSLVTPGLTSFTNYKKDKFSELIWDLNDQFKAPIGTGFGFDDLLNNLQWQKL